MFYPGRVVSLSFHESFRPAKIRLTLFQRLEIEQVCALVVGGSKPVGGAGVSGAHSSTFRARLYVSTDRTSFLVDALRPIQFVCKTNRRQKLPVFTIQNVKEPVPVRLHQEFS